MKLAVCNFGEIVISTNRTFIVIDKVHNNFSPITLALFNNKKYQVSRIPIEKRTECETVTLSKVKIFMFIHDYHFSCEVEFDILVFFAITIY